LKTKLISFILIILIIGIFFFHIFALRHGLPLFGIVLLFILDTVIMISISVMSSIFSPSIFSTLSVTIIFIFIVNLYTGIPSGEYMIVPNINFSSLSKETHDLTIYANLFKGEKNIGKIGKIKDESYSVQYKNRKGYHYSMEIQRIGNKYKCFFDINEEKEGYMVIYLSRCVPKGLLFFVKWIFIIIGIIINLSIIQTMYQI